MLRRLLYVGFVCVPLLAGDVFTAIRENDLAGVRAGDVAARDRNGVTPLQYASAMGSLEAMKILIARKADVNAADNQGATPLMWAACEPARVSLLLANGAAAGAKTKAGRTPLRVASGCPGALESVKMLIAKGADGDKGPALMEAAYAGGPAIMRALLAAGAKADAVDEGGFSALMAATGWGDAALVREMLAKGAKVNAASVYAGKVVHGDIELKKLTALMMAAPLGNVEMVKTLLDAGAEVNGRDGRGMTPLQFAVASSRANVGIVKLLLEKGADVNAVSKAGETALDWARKYGKAEVIAAVESAGGKGSAVPMAPGRTAAPLAARAAAEKSVRLLQASVDTFFTASNCVACHHQPPAALAVKSAREAGLAVDEKQAGMMKKTMAALLAPRPSATLAMELGPPGLDGLTNTTLALAAAGQEAGLLTDSAAAVIASKQRPDGSWGESVIAIRTPMFGSPVTQTMSAVRAMQLYAFPARNAEMEGRVVKARRWLQTAEAPQPHERAERLLALGWTGGSGAALRKAAEAVVRDQRPDGGWGQLNGMESDAYATAMALRAMRESGVAGQFAVAYEKGVAYLLRTQLEDGSWYVRSRGVKLQPYFQSGFPHEHEQWISFVATANAVVALLGTSPGAASGN